MKIYKWIRHMVMFSGIPALTMLFACSCKYGMPEEDVIWGQVLDRETNNPISEVEVKTENHGQTSTDEYGCFELYSTNCDDISFRKEGYATKDTLLCHNQDNTIFLEKLPVE